MGFWKKLFSSKITEKYQLEGELVELTKDEQIDKQKPEKSRFQRLWPIISTEKDAIYVAKHGLVACILIAAANGIINYLQYINTKDIEPLFGGIVIVIIYSILGYFIFRMSRMASVLAFLLFAAEKIYSYHNFNHKIGYGIVIIWFLFQSNRATFWYHNNKEIKKEEIIVPDSLSQQVLPQESRLKKHAIIFSLICLFILGFFILAYVEQRTTIFNFSELGVSNAGDEYEFIKKIMENEKIADEMEKVHPGIKDQMAGYLMSFWLPHGATRKIIMFTIALVALIGGGIYRKKSFFLLLLILPFFSPRMVGEIFMFIGIVIRFFGGT